jgi:hypothetical protein
MEKPEIFVPEHNMQVLEDISNPPTPKENKIQRK